MSTGSKIALALFLLFFAGILGFCCLGAVFIGSVPQKPLPVGTIKPSPDAETPEIAIPAGPTRTLRLAAPPGARQDDLEKCVSILNRRFTKTQIPAHAAIGSGTRILVRLSDDKDVLRRAGALLSAGGHLQFKEFRGPAAMPAAEIKAQVERIAPLKASHAYDASKETFDAIPSEDEDGKKGLVVNNGSVEGHLVATALPRHTDDTGWVIDFSMSPEGADAFEEFSKRLLEKQFAVILDDVIKMVFTSKGVIRENGMMFRSENGGFSKDEASALAALMVSGRLPIDLSLEED